MTATMRFVGVTTASSSIMQIFPRWARLLGIDADLVGLDIPLDADQGAYRSALEQMHSDPRCAGALVTTHKIALLAATRDQFDELDPFATAVGEVSSIAFRDGRTIGSAKDPITAGFAIEEFLAPGHFTSGADVLCLGAGGAGTAIGWYLGQRPDPPQRMTFVDVSQPRLSHLRDVLTRHSPGLQVDTVLLDDHAEHDLPGLLAGLPRGSLIINATGLGKDRPGSPLPEGSVFPQGAVVWELNYRGSLEFLHQARAQEVERGLTVVDGWRYFIHGWTQVIADVFGVPMTPERVALLSEEATSA